MTLLDTALVIYVILQLVGLYVLLAPAPKVEEEMTEQELVQAWRRLKVKQQKEQTNGKT